MRGRAPPVQQAGRGKQERSVHTEATRRVVCARAAIHSIRRGRAHACVRPGAAGNEQRVDPRGRVAEVGVGG